MNQTDINYQPLVSVIIPAYNAEKWLALTVYSVLGQSYQNLEIIIVDDGSSDSTPDIIRKLAEQDDRIVTASQVNQGVGATRNHGIRLARGEYLAPLDADDLWRSDKIEKQLNCMLEAKKSAQPVAMVYCWSEIIDAEGFIIRKGVPRKGPQGYVFSHLMEDNFLGNGSTPLFDTNVVHEVGRFHEGEGCGCEDWILYMMIARKYRVAGVEEYLVGYRQLEESLSRNATKMLRANQVMIEVLRKELNDLKPSEIRNCKSSLYLWLLYRARPCSSVFFKILGLLFANDLFFWCRLPTLRKVYRMIYTRVYRMGGKLRNRDSRRQRFELE
ncbi:glycosyltransferase family 2 protein [Coraliomargarita sp. W4R53]